MGLLPGPTLPSGKHASKVIKVATLLVGIGELFHIPISLEAPPAKNKADTQSLTTFKRCKDKSLICLFRASESQGSAAVSFLGGFMVTVTATFTAGFEGPQEAQSLKHCLLL